MLQGVPGDVYNILTNPAATITVLSPPQKDTNGLLYSFNRRADVDRMFLYEIVSMHLLRDHVDGNRLRANPDGATPLSQSMMMLFLNRELGGTHMKLK